MSPHKKTTHQNTYQILVIDDDDAFRHALSQSLATAGHAVFNAPNGEAALQLLQETSLDVAVSDVHMPKMNGIEFIKASKKLQPKLRVILMTGFGDLAEKIDAASLGCSTFLLKPFRKEELLEAIESVMVRVKWIEFDPKRFASIPVDDFNDLPIIRYPLYVKLPDDRFLRIANVGDSIPKERLALVRTKNISEIWISAEHFEKYFSKNLNTIQETVKSRGKTALGDQSKNLVAHSSGIALERMRLLSFTQEAIDESVGILSASISLLVKDSENSEIASILGRLQPTIHSNSVTCASIIAYLTRIMGWKSQKTVSAIVVGALLHDIGLVDAEPEVLAAADPKTDPSEENVKKYREHPAKGFKLIADLENISIESKKIVLQHHEKVSGDGFPMGHSKTQISPLARLVGFVSDYLDFLSRSKDLLESDSPVVKLNKFLAAHPMQYDAKDAKLLEIALAEPDSRKANLKYQSECKS